MTYRKPTLTTLSSAGDVPGLGMAREPVHRVGADRDQREAFAPRDLDQPLHEAARSAGAPQRDRGFHMVDEDLAALAAIVGEHQLAGLGHLESARLRVVLHVRHETSSA